MRSPWSTSVRLVAQARVSRAISGSAAIIRGRADLSRQVSNRVLGQHRVAQRPVDIRRVAVPPPLRNVCTESCRDQRRHLREEGRCARDGAVQQDERDAVARHLMPGPRPGNGDVDVPIRPKSQPDTAGEP